MASSHPAGTVYDTAALGYWVQARQPLTSLIFVLPMLLAYEAGIILLNKDAIRNGAEVWLRTTLDAVGFGQYFLLPVLTITILLAWHHTTHQPWQVSPSVFYGMAVESILLAFCLQKLLHLQTLFRPAIAQIAAQLPGSQGMMSAAQRVVRTSVAYLGAGIYEELLFRVILLSATIWTLRWLGVPRRPGLFLAIVLTSLLFSAAHYLGVYGEPIHWFSFLFRFLAGMFFAVLFVYRGFGVAVGAHAGYDILVG